MMGRSIQLAAEGMSGLVLKLPSNRAVALSGPVIARVTF
jgi:hypothetical protein